MARKDTKLKANLFDMEEEIAEAAEQLAKETSTPEPSPSSEENINNSETNKKQEEVQEVPMVISEKPSSNQIVKAGSETDFVVRDVFSPIIDNKRPHRSFQPNALVDDALISITTDPKTGRKKKNIKGVISKMVNNGLIRELVELGALPPEALNELQDYF
ncbi:TPA: hypothetical protein ACGO1T_001912 [Streptococcus suis]